MTTEGLAERARRAAEEVRERHGIEHAAFHAASARTRTSPGRFAW